MTTEGFSPQISRRDFLRLGFVGVAGLLAGCQAEQSPVGEVATLAEWSAGAVDVNVFYQQGQGYLAYDQQHSALSFFSIQHVFSEQMPDYSLQYLPSSTPVTFDVPGYGDVSGYSVGNLRYMERAGDLDTSVRFEIPDHIASGILSTGIAPYYRMYEHSRFVPGAFVASPRHDKRAQSGKPTWTVYQVTSINRIQFEMQDINGNLCHGRSGGPLILVEDLNKTGNTIVPIRSRNNRCIVVGESEAGYKRAVQFDEAQTGNLCYTDMIGNRVSI